MQYIGITERGDAGIDLSWVNKLYDANIIITKNPTDKFIEKVLEHKNKIILHATVTGYGGGILEPKVPSYRIVNSQLVNLIKKGFPKEQVVLRVDPIIPTEKGIETAKIVLSSFNNLGIKRVRYSFLDLYPHVRERFAEADVPLPYPSFTAPKRMIQNALDMLSEFEGIYELESCAEYTPHRIGCISSKDLKILGVEIDPSPGGYQRRGCLCLGNKRELLNNKKRCWHQCLYCYWKD